MEFGNYLSLNIILRIISPALVEIVHSGWASTVLRCAFYATKNAFDCSLSVLSFCVVHR